MKVIFIKTPDLLHKKDIEYEQYVQQFEEEGQRLAKFSDKPHPHIVKVRDYFLEDTLPCLVMVNTLSMFIPLLLPFTTL